MKKYWILGMTLCITALLVGCNSNTAKESPKVDTKITASSSASETEIADDVEIDKTSVSDDVQKKSEITTVQTESKPTTSTQSTSQNDKKVQVTTKQEVQSKQEVTSSSQKKEEKPKVEVSENKKPSTPVKPEEPKQEIPKNDPPMVESQNFDVTPYVNYANEYARSIGLKTDMVATDCWDNPISANASKKSIKNDITGRLNRYKNSEGCEGVWIWTVKESDSDYLIYIGYY